MRYWWVNQNQTFNHEIAGGYMWSPRRKKSPRHPGGQVNPFYEFMREVSPGDLVFSFNNKRIEALGIAESYVYDAIQPAEFGASGDAWALDGWRVDVRYERVMRPFAPADHMAELRHHLPTKYSPLQSSGRGNQIYLAHISETLAHTLLRLLGNPSLPSPSSDSTDLVRPNPLDDEAERAIVNASELDQTEKAALIMARRGQGLFRQRLERIESRCRVTGVTNRVHLIASHCKAWRHSTNGERLDGHNGLLLTPSVDHLFDKGFISFDDLGLLLISPVADSDALRRMGIAPDASPRVEGFLPKQSKYLKWHRENVFKRAQVG